METTTLNILTCNVFTKYQSLHTVGGSLDDIYIWNTPDSLVV